MRGGSGAAAPDCARHPADPMTDRRPTGDGRGGSAPQDPRELRNEIERTRSDVGDTMDALAAKADVRGQAKQKANEVRGRARQRVASGSAAVRHKSDEVRGRLAEHDGGRAGSMRDTMQDQAQHVSEAARADKRRTGLIGAIAGIIALRGIVRWRRRRAERGTARQRLAGRSARVRHKKDEVRGRLVEQGGGRAASIRDTVRHRARGKADRAAGRARGRADRARRKKDEVRGRLAGERDCGPTRSIRDIR